MRGQLPASPGTVLDIGCGPLGGFVPALLAEGYDAIGVDPHAPDGAPYRNSTFEQLDAPGHVDAVIASTSLHHVDDLDDVLDRITALLPRDGTVVVLEWAWERFDEPTARWCFERLARADEGAHKPWIQHHRDRWAASGEAWSTYFDGWAAEHSLHPGGSIIDALDARFDRRGLTEGPYFFGDLALATEADEQAAIDAGEIRATGLRYTAVRRAP